MEKKNFIFTLFNNGNGLTLAQIDELNKALTGVNIPDGMIDDVTRELGDELTPDEIMESCADLAREVFFDNLRDCADLLEIRDYMAQYDLDLTDMQVYRIYYLRED